MRAQDVVAAGDVFDRLGWSTQEEKGKAFPQLFETYCRMLEKLAQDERELILVITERYRWHKYETLPNSFMHGWRALMQQLDTTITHLVVLPLQKPGSKGPKSSDQIFGIAANLELTLRDEAGGRSVALCGTPKLLRKQVQPKTALILIDDYVGTGETASKCIENVRRKYPHCGDMDTYVLTIAAHRAAVIALQRVACKVVCSEVYDKGISQNPAVANHAGAIAIMQRIEKMLHISKNQNLGYGKTEGLATFMRTPNNTFPIFWANRKIKGAQWPAPFPRIRHDI